MSHNSPGSKSKNVTFDSTFGSAKKKKTLKRLMSKILEKKNGSPEHVIEQFSSSDDDAQPIYSMQSTVKGGGFAKELYLKLF